MSEGIARLSSSPDDRYDADSSGNLRQRPERERDDVDIRRLERRGVRKDDGAGTTRSSLTPTVTEPWIATGQTATSGRRSSARGIEPATGAPR